MCASEAKASARPRPTAALHQLVRLSPSLRRSPRPADPVPHYQLSGRAVPTGVLSPSWPFCRPAPVRAPPVLGRVPRARLLQTLLLPDRRRRDRLHEWAAIAFTKTGHLDLFSLTGPRRSSALPLRPLRSFSSLSRSRFVSPRLLNISCAALWRTRTRLGRPTSTLSCVTLSPLVLLGAHPS